MSLTMDNDESLIDIILQELKQNKNERDLNTFRKLLKYPPRIYKKTWEPVLCELLKIIIDDQMEYIDEKRLASQIFFTIFAQSYNSHYQENNIVKLLTVNDSKLFIFDNEYILSDIDLFKLIIAYGYLLASNQTSLTFEIFSLIFKIIQKYCMIYTKYMYFTFKLLHIWMKKSIEINFWNGNNLKIEKELEAIIFSNWDNCINDIAKINASDLFPMYLEIMNEKYAGYIQYIIKITDEYMSWENPTKFIIITELYKWAAKTQNLPWYHTNKVASSISFSSAETLQFRFFGDLIVQSLIKNYLKCVALKLYSTLLEIMDVELWNLTLAHSINASMSKWEIEQNASALHILWELLMKPTLIKFKNHLIESTWKYLRKHEMTISASYFTRIASELGISWKQLNLAVEDDSKFSHVWNDWEKCGITKVPFIINVFQDCVKLNAFVTYCRMKDIIDDDDYEICKRFLYINIKNRSAQFRKGMFDNFKILFERIIKIQSNNEISFVEWLYYFILDCFEVGSCYQRKISGLKLYEIILMYTSTRVNNSNVKKKKYVQDGISLREAMIKIGKWHFENKFSFFILLKLCLDSIDEIREHSFNIINNYFDLNLLSEEEMEILISKTTEMCKSPRFYEIAGGAKLTLIINKYGTTSITTPLHKKLLEILKTSLSDIKHDLFKALLEGSEFNASLLILLEMKFHEEIKNSSENFFAQLLDVMEDSTVFFLSALTPEGSDACYSSSFLEMGIAIEKAIEISGVPYNFDKDAISPAHQIILSCIWMALKTLCDLATKISIEADCYHYVKRSLDIIVSVLMKCRHKGAIEAAGVALGASVRYLAEKKNHLDLIDTYLDKLLNLNENDKIDLTRRGAGLSIMFHKMISNDNKKTHRLLHIALKRLIKSLRHLKIEYEVENSDSHQDCVVARQLHFLRTIVADKVLHPHLVVYIEQISLICFEHLESREWTIRNASLQLLGALIPRLVGQSPKSDLDFGNGYLVDHFFTHYPILAEFVFQKVNDSSAFNLDSNMVPIITLISKMSVGGCEYTDYSSQEYTTNLRNAVYQLLGHSVDHVRYAAAKAYAALTPVHAIPEVLFNMKMEYVGNKTRNFIHGHLMTQICLNLIIAREKLAPEPSTHNNMRKFSKESDEIQLKRVKSLIEYWEQTLNNAVNEKPLCNIIEAAFLQNFRMASIFKEKNCEVEDLISYTNFLSIMKYGLVKRTLGFSEFNDQLFKIKPYNENVHSYQMNLDHCDEFIALNIIWYSINHYHKTKISDNLIFNVIDNSVNYLLKIVKSNISNSTLWNRIVMVLIRLIVYHGRSSIYSECNYTDHVCRSIHSSEGLYRRCMWWHLLKKTVYIFKSKNHPYESQNKCIDKLHEHGHYDDFCLHKYLLSLINNNEQNCIWVVEVLPLPVHNNCYSYNTLYDLGPEILLALIVLASNDSSEIRTALHKKFVEYGCLFDKEVKCVWKMNECKRDFEFWFHNLIKSLANLEKYISLYHNAFLMSNVIKNNDILEKNEIRSPFDEDEQYCEITKILNIYHYFRNSSYNVKDKNSCLLKPCDYTNIIMSSTNFLKIYISHLNIKGINDLRAIFDFKLVDYLNYQAKFYEKQFIEYDLKLYSNVNEEAS